MSSSKSPQGRSYNPAGLPAGKSINDFQFVFRSVVKISQLGQESRRKPFFLVLFPEMNMTGLSIYSSARQTFDSTSSLGQF